jgi:hypothetical protein
MPTENEISAELDSVIHDVPELFALCKKTEDIPKFGAKYQSWYSRAIKLVELLGKDRLDEFRGYYLIDPKRKSFDASTYVIQDYVKGIGATTDAWSHNQPNWDINNAVSLRLLTQSQILQSLRARLGSVLSDVRGHLLAEIEDEELAVAQRLLKINLRASGAVAGVVLEGHLQQVAANHSVKIQKKNPTLADLNNALKEAAVYDLPMWRKIQHLADIRNLCDHKRNRGPIETEVTELISGVSSIVKSLF